MTCTINSQNNNVCFCFSMWVKWRSIWKESMTKALVQQPLPLPLPHQNPHKILMLVIVMMMCCEFWWWQKMTILLYHTTGKQLLGNKEEEQRKREEREVGNLCIFTSFFFFQSRDHPNCKYFPYWMSWGFWNFRAESWPIQAHNNLRQALFLITTITNVIITRRSVTNILFIQAWYVLCYLYYCYQYYLLIIVIIYILIIIIIIIIFIYYYCGLTLHFCRGNQSLFFTFLLLLPIFDAWISFLVTRYGCNIVRLIPFLIILSSLSFTGFHHFFCYYVHFFLSFPSVSYIFSFSCLSAFFSPQNLAGVCSRNNGLPFDWKKQRNILCSITIWVGTCTVNIKWRHGQWE